MATGDIIFGPDGRIIVVATLAGRISGRGEFRAMIAPRREIDPPALVELVLPLLRAGCREIACMGPRPEQLHDMVDEVVEADNALDVVTTWHDDLDEGCWYFARVSATPLQLVLTDRDDLADAIRRALAD